MSYDYVTRPATAGRVQELLHKIEDDEARLDSITASYGRVGISPERDTEYQRLAKRIRDRFSLAEDLAAEMGIDEFDL